MMSKKLHAFTIAELVIAMLITTICISLAYFGLRFISSQWISTEKKTGQKNEFMLLKNALETAANSAQTIHQINDEREGLSFESKGSSVSFFSVANKIVRLSDLQADTFFVRMTFSDFGFVGDDKRLVKYFSVNGILNDQPISCFIEKSYSAAELLNEESNK